jgi:hypothetical protein
MRRLRPRLWHVQEVVSRVLQSDAAALPEDKRRLKIS